MTKEEMKNKYSAFITEISEILGLGKPVDILKLCATTDLFFQPLEKRIATLEKENKVLVQNLEDTEILNKTLVNRNAELKELLKQWLQTSKASGCDNINIVTDTEQFLSEVEDE